MDSGVGAVLAEQLDDALQVERTKKVTVEAKGLSVITTSGALVTLLFGLTTVMTGKDAFPPHGVAAGFLFAGLALFVVASMLGIYCYAPGRYLEIDPASLYSLATPEVWLQDGAEASRELALARLRVLRNWRQVNIQKTRVLVTAISLEVAGVASVAVTAILAAT